MMANINKEERKIKIKLLSDYVINNITASRKDILLYASSIGLDQTYDYLMKLFNRYLDNDTLLKLEHVFIEKLKVVANYIIDKKPTMEETTIYAKSIGINKTYQSLMKLFHEYLDKEVLNHVEKLNKSRMEDIANFIIKNNATVFETTNYAISIGINFNYEILKKMLYQYLDDKTIKSIEEIRKSNINANRDYLFDNKKNYIKKKLANLSNETLTEIFLMALTYHLSFHNICILFKCSFDDLELAIKKCLGLEEPMHYLDLTTINESKDASEKSYASAEWWWNKRQNLIEDKKNVQTKEVKDYVNELLKEHRSLIDDSYIEVIKTKDAKDLTLEEKEMIARLRIKYGLSANQVAVVTNKKSSTIVKYCNNLTLKDPAYNEQLDILNSYNKNNFINDLAYKKK